MKAVPLAGCPQRVPAWVAWGMALCLGFPTGCGGRGAEAPPADPALRAQELIESGNQAFRAGNYGLAARRYAAAAVVRKDDPAAYYGMGMALSKLGRDEEARQAYRQARELAQAQAGAAERGPDPAPGSP